MISAAQQIAGNLARVGDQIAAATAAAGRAPGSVQLVAVCKYVGPAETKWLVDAGCCDLGESRPQQLWDKADALGETNVRWHLVGHLQRNKVRRTLPVTSLIHSVDSARLLQEIDRCAGECSIHAKVLLEVNCSGDVEKHGLAAQEARRLIDRLVEFEDLSVVGLMTMAPRVGGQELARNAFAKLRRLRDELQSAAPQVNLDELSMGMSGDFQEAIAEGATLVRIGSALFQGVAGRSS